MSNPGGSTMHDDLLFSMLKDCKTLPVFLDSIFGFLNRRTDFYCIAKEPNSPIGLPPGLAETIVKQTFYKWKPKEKLFNESEIPEAVEEVEIKNSVDERSPVYCNAETEQHFTSSECYNGAICDNYSWSQNIVEVDIVVKVPKNVTIKDLVVEVFPDKISVRLKDDTILLEGNLYDKCKHNDVLWSLHKTMLDIHLDKCREVWWNCLLQAEPKLDISKLDCSRPYEELSEEAQTKIEELQWNQEQKRLGQPTSDELAMRDIVKKSWSAEGSPFSGPYDPSIVRFN